MTKTNIEPAPVQEWNAPPFWEATMRKLICGFLGLLSGVCLLAPDAMAQTLSGQVTSAEEGPMEGVLVSAKRAGSTVTVTVATDAQGRYSFPNSKLQPGDYNLRIRAVGYDLDGPATIAVGEKTTADLRLRKTEDLAAQLSNGEWLASVPGTDAQKNGLLNCIGCHTLERVVKSAYTPDDFMHVLLRM